MMRAGVAVSRRWNPDEEEMEAVVAAVFLSMCDAKCKLLDYSPNSNSDAARFSSLITSGE
jgi:hypothetical protein